MSRRDPYRLPERIGAEIEATAPAGTGDLRRISEAWVDAVGPALAAHAMPARRRQDGTLVIHAADASWQQAVELERRRLVALLRERLGPDAVGDLRIEIGPVPRAPAASAPVAADPTIRVPGARARALTAGVADERLRAAIATVIEHTSGSGETRS